MNKPKNESVQSVEKRSTLLSPEPPLLAKSLSASIYEKGFPSPEDINSLFVYALQEIHLDSEDFFSACMGRPITDDDIGDRGELLIQVDRVAAQRLIKIARVFDAAHRHFGQADQIHHFIYGIDYRRDERRIEMMASDEGLDETALYAESIAGESGRTALH